MSLSIKAVGVPLAERDDGAAAAAFGEFGRELLEGRGPRRRRSIGGLDAGGFGRQGPPPPLPRRDVQRLRGLRGTSTSVRRRRRPCCLKHGRRLPCSICTLRACAH
jgi:hypothetical protein